MKSVSYMVSVILVVSVWPLTAVAQSKDALVGTWKLVSATQTNEKKESRPAFGMHPTGFVTYTAEGRMSVVINSAGRAPLSVNDYRAAPAEERAAAFATMVAYAGTYTLTGDKVIHHVEASWMPNQVGTDLTRTVKLQGNRLTLRTPPMRVGGEEIVAELVWERLK